ncbi:MAG: radical SAM protein [Patescibacteria group bacterium]
MEKINKQVKIAWYGIHTGEEPPLSPAGGIFFSACNLHCVFCQNYQISQENKGDFYNIEQLAQIMLDLQTQGAKNIDLVTPTLWSKQIKEAIILAKKQNLTIPIVWNSNAYEDVKIIEEMAGLVDIYLPDFKYSRDEIAFKYSGVKNYFMTAKNAILAMYKQVGLLKEKNGVASKGIIIRHLVLPNNLENSFGVLAEIAKIDNKIHISLMNQYSPLHKAKEFSEINCTVSKKDFQKVYDHLLELGFENGWVQEESSQENLIPDFNKKNPFN